MKNRFWLHGLAIVWATIMVATGLRASTFSEPFTTFYGKVVERGTRQQHQLTAGELTWTIKKADSNDIVLRTTLYKLNQGEFSYRIDVPHDALALGLTANANFASIPMKVTGETHAHFLIGVDGRIATPVGPASVTFDVSQALRSSVYRLDLEVDSPWVDSDGDGLPDWWEDANGLDKQNSGDALLDGDGDGLINSNEFKAGLNPSRDNRLPLMNTSYLLAYADGSTSFILDVVDSDSVASQLVYTVTSVPGRGSLLLRNCLTNPVIPDAAIFPGTKFTQADVEQGRLLYVHGGEGIEPLLLGVTLSDENSAHTPLAVQLPIYQYRPGAGVLASTFATNATALSGGTALLAASFSGDEQKLRNYMLSRQGGYVIRDGSTALSSIRIATPSSSVDPLDYSSSYVGRFGLDYRHVLVGGSGNDSLSGGMENDVLIGSSGTNSLRGNLGSDWFVFVASASGPDTIEDFSVAEQDVIDLTRLVIGSNDYVESYLRLDVGVTSAPVLRVDSSGLGTGYSNLAITIRGLSASNAILGQLVDDGRIVIAGRKAKPQITIAVLSSTASENGPTDGEFILTRSGSISESLAINIQVNGSAANGVDYSSIGTNIVFPAGVRQIVQKVSPFADSETEVAETVQIIIQSGVSYTVGILDRASLTIADLKMLVSVEALEPLAVKSTLEPGMFLITREAIIDRSVLVRFALSGTATKGSDYQSVVSYVNMVPYQTTALIQITPLAGAVISGGAESIFLTLTADASYSLGATNRALIHLVDRADTLASWRAREFPGSSGSLEEFSQADTGNTGIKNLLRYAFGLDPLAPQSQADRLPRYSIQDGRLTVDFYRNPGALDIDYRVLSAPDITLWPTQSEAAEDATAELGSTNAAAMRFRAKTGTNDTSRGFISIEVLGK